jgi:hypothetical protein
VISFLVHLLGLTLPGAWLGYRLRLSFPLRIGLLFLVFEASLIVGGCLLSWAGVLGHPVIYKFGTTLCAFAIAAGLWIVARQDEPGLAKPAPLPKSTETTVARLSSAASIVMLLVFAGIMLYLTLSAYPVVEDSLTVKLPKVVFAIEANSILPTHLADDGRMYLAPVYPVLVQLFLIISGQSGHALLVFGLVNWVVCGFAVHQLCRDVGASKSASWIVTALALLSPVLVTQGTSEGDDLMSATPFLISLIFLSAWLRRGGYFFPVVAGLGLGFAVGFKFLALFFVPAIPIVLVFAILQYPWPEITTWLRSRWVGAVALSVAFVVALAPHLIVTWAAFGNPFFVSAGVLATRNAPFSIDCGLRNVVGYTKSFLFSDFTHLLTSATPDFGARWVVNFVKRVVLHTPLVWRLASSIPDIPDHVALMSYADGYKTILSNVLPYDPTLNCAAWGDRYNPTRTYINDNTVWYGVFGPLLLVSALATAFSRNRSLWLRTLGLGFIVWVVAFALSQKYLAEIGRYWSVAVLAGSPTVALVIDGLMKRGALAPLRRSMVLAAGFITALLAIAVLSDSGHRSIRRDEKVRYVDGFNPELRALMKSAPALNVQVAYGINTYDYYMLLGNGAKLTSLATIAPQTLNLVIVRPAGLIDNIYQDPRIPVRMKRPFAKGFAYSGKTRPQPGYEYSLAFVNNTEMTEHTDLSARSVFLLFQAGVRLENSTVVGSIQQIADAEIARKVRFRIGWREPGGALVMADDWQRGLSADLKIPEQAAAIVVQAAIDGTDNEGTAEWPVRGFRPEIVTALDSK